MPWTRIASAKRDGGHIRGERRNLAAFEEYRTESLRLLDVKKILKNVRFPETISFLKSGIVEVTWVPSVKAFADKRNHLVKCIK